MLFVVLVPFSVVLAALGIWFGLMLIGSIFVLIGAAFASVIVVIGKICDFFLSLFKRRKSIDNVNPWAARRCQPVPNVRTFDTNLKRGMWKR